MAGQQRDDPPDFTIVDTAAQEVADSASDDAWENEGGASSAVPGNQPPAARSPEEHEQAIEELVLALYSEDVRLGIVRDRDMLDAGGALSARGGSRYYQRASQILASLTRVSDMQILHACAAEPAGTPRGAAARAELRLRGLTMP